MNSKVLVVVFEGHSVSEHVPLSMVANQFMKAGMFRI